MPTVFDIDVIYCLRGELHWRVQNNDNKPYAILPGLKMPLGKVTESLSAYTRENWNLLCFPMYCGGTGRRIGVQFASADTERFLAAFPHHRLKIAQLTQRREPSSELSVTRALSALSI